MKKSYQVYIIAILFSLQSINSFGQLSGTVTVNSASTTSGNNYQGFSALAAQINSAGVSGPLVVNVIANSGPYVEQPVFNQAPGVSLTNTITINGNNNTITFNSTNNVQPWTLLLNGADYMNFNGLTVVAQGSVYGVGALLCSGANYNTFKNCTFSVIANGSGSNQIPVAINGSSLSTQTAGISGSYNSFINCNMLNGYMATLFTGPANAPFSTNNTLLNCTMSDWYYSGFFAANQQSLTINYCAIDRPTRTQTGTGYGIVLSTGMQGGTTCMGNCIQNFFGSAPTATGNIFGIYNTSFSQGLPANTFSNNIINNLGGNNSVYGIYFATNIKGVCNSNTIILNNTASTSTANCYGVYIYNNSTDSAHIVNNYIQVTQGGSAYKFGMYLASSTNLLVNQNQYYIASSSGTTFTGYAPNLGNSPSFTYWQSGGYDLQGVNYSANPILTITPHCGIGVPSAPVSGINVSTALKCQASAVTFSDNSTNNPTTWNWSVSPPAGVTVTLPGSQNPQITFGSSGIYSVTVLASNSVGPGFPSTQVVNINSQPILTLAASANTICSNVAVSFSASGAANYTWSPGNITGSPVSFTPSVSTTYTCIGTGSNGCTNTNQVSLIVNPCTGINPELRPGQTVLIYPNPGHGEFRLLNTNYENAVIQLYNMLGQKLTTHVMAEGDVFKVDLNPGIYLAYLLVDDKPAGYTRLIID